MSRGRSAYGQGHLAADVARLNLAAPIPAAGFEARYAAGLRQLLARLALGPAQGAAETGGLTCMNAVGGR